MRDNQKYRETKITNHNPNRDCSLAWKELNGEYDPDVGMALADLKKEFAQSKLELEQKPEEWIRSLEKIQTKLKTHGHTISNDDMILHILCNLPEVYNNMIECLEESYGSQTLDIKTIKQSLKSRYKRIMKYMEDKNNTQTALFAKQFKGHCRHCGKIGHKAVDCHRDQTHPMGMNTRVTMVGPHW